MKGPKSPVLAKVIRKKPKKVVSEAKPESQEALYIGAL